MGCLSLGALKGSENPDESIRLFSNFFREHLISSAPPGQTLAHPASGGCASIHQAPTLIGCFVFKEQLRFPRRRKRCFHPSGCRFANPSTAPQLPALASLLCQQQRNEIMKTFFWAVKSS
jgi:hypothetical protein